MKEVSKLYNVNFGVLDVLNCEHYIAYTKCAECCQNVSTMWLLDSGPSANFTMHCRLGLSSKEVLKRAKDHIKGFPDGLLIPATSNICPGCAQGKMPAHPLLDTWATEAYKQIQTNLKSFPELSYHKYEYFIVFLDDYTSFDWVLLLRNKASALLPLSNGLH